MFCCLQLSTMLSRFKSIKFSPVEVQQYFSIVEKYMYVTCCTAGFQFVLYSVTGVFFPYDIFRKILKRRISFCNKAWQKMRRVEKMKLYLCTPMLPKYASRLYVLSYLLISALQCSLHVQMRHSFGHAFQADRLKNLFVNYNKEEEEKYCPFCSGKVLSLHDGHARS